MSEITTCSQYYHLENYSPPSPQKKTTQKNKPKNQTDKKQKKNPRNNYNKYY